MKTTLNLFLVICLMTCFSCNLINPAEELPGYIHIPRFEFSSQPGLGSSSENITEIWVYSDAQFIGAYDLPADVPVVNNGNTLMSFRAGIRTNGISNTREAYPFYTTDDRQLNIVDLETDTIVPDFTYIENIADPALLDDFDGGTLLVEESDSQVEMTTTQDPEDVFEGSGSGKVVIGADQTIFRAQSFDTFMDLPNNRRTFVELDYKCNNSFGIGLYSYRSDGSRDKNLALILVPTTNENGEEEWNKVYIDLLEITSSTPNATHYELYIESLKDEGVTEAVMFFDNLKILHF